MRRTPIYATIGSLLATLAIAAALPASAAVRTFTGTEMNDTPTPGPSALCSPGQLYVAFSPTTATTSGTSNFGGFGPTMAHCLTPPPTNYSGGMFDFTFDQGDVISGTYSGFFTPTGTPNVLNTFVDYVVTGGTGRFLGASGMIHGVGILDRTVPRPLNSLTLSGTLDMPAVPEPATWAMMITGFGLVGAAARRRRTASPAMA